MNIVMLSGGVGGARLARGLAVVPGVDLSVIVNVGDDDRDYGLAVSPDLDTVMYTISGIESERGWGLADDTFTVMEHLAAFGAQTTMSIGDADLGTKLFRTIELARGVPLSEVTGRMAEVLGLAPTILPVTDDIVRTVVQTDQGEWISFREYFVHRQHQETVTDLRFEGAGDASPAPGVIEAITNADAVVVGPSNPPLSIWPILAVPGIAEAIGSHERVLGVSPLIDGEAVKGPADRVLKSLGFPPGNEGVLAAYDRVINELVIDQRDATDRGRLTARGATVHVRDTNLRSLDASKQFANWLVEIL